MASLLLIQPSFGTYQLILIFHEGNVIFTPLIKKFIMLEDFNSERTDANLKDFCNLYLLKNLIKKSMCFKTANFIPY